MKKERFLILTALVAIGLGIFFAGVQFGDVYGDGLIHHNMGWQDGFKAGNNKAIVTFQRLGVPQALCSEYMYVQTSHRPENFDLFTRKDACGFLQCDKEIDQYYTNWESNSNTSNLAGK
jgi:hypothetical protein